jgi:hypothetical protein
MDARGEWCSYEACVRALMPRCERPKSPIKRKRKRAHFKSRHIQDLGTRRCNEQGARSEEKRPGSGRPGMLSIVAVKFSGGERSAPVRIERIFLVCLDYGRRTICASLRVVRRSSSYTSVRRARLGETRLRPGSSGEAWKLGCGVASMEIAICFSVPAVACVERRYGPWPFHRAWPGAVCVRGVFCGADGWDAA